MVAGGLAAALVTAVALVAVVATSGPSSRHAERAASARRTAASAGVHQQAPGVAYTRHAVKTSGNTYGYVPAWLGQAKVPVGRLVVATPAHPWLAIQGDTVRVKLPRAQVLATVSGPAVPRQRHLQVPRTSPCTFAVTLTDASAPIAIAPSQFAAIDEQGRVHAPKVTSQDGGQPASEVRPGQTVELKLYAVLPTGQGRITWSPTAGVKPTVQWDFDVETD